VNDDETSGMIANNEQHPVFNVQTIISTENDDDDDVL
jgi:hypothetical protein